MTLKLIAEAPTDGAAPDLFALAGDLMHAAHDLRQQGWTVNLAIETGSPVESFTLSASREPADVS